MLSTLISTKIEDTTGYAYLSAALAESQDAAQFFGGLVNGLFSNLADTNQRLGTPYQAKHQRRVLEFLGYAANKGWLLFPFVHHSSGLQEHYILSHARNMECIFNPAYWDPDVVSLVAKIDAIPVIKTTHVSMGKHLKNLILASSYRTLADASFSLFERCQALFLAEDRPMIIQSTGMARYTYNMLGKIYNSDVGAMVVQPLEPPSAKQVLLTEFVSFQYLRDLSPRWDEWASAAEGFLRQGVDTQGQLKKMAMQEFFSFLTGHPAPPARPSAAHRGFINDFTKSGDTFRNWLRQRQDLSPDSRNNRLNQVSQFFDYIAQLSSMAEVAGRVTRFINPVDMRFDRFSVNYRAGTTRKAIASHVIEVMREILVENDYAWPRKMFKSDWAHLTNSATGAIEYVWVPSATLLLYTLLSVPLRGIQARMLDSGEGDAEIYDFQSGRMIPNLNQLPVKGRLNPRRQEGLFQVTPSGMLGVSDIVGLWISTNKTSDDGYLIPWVSTDLMAHLRYQREWILKYAPHPKTHCISEAQGHRNTPNEWKETERQYYCLFRDPAVARTVAQSLPVSKQKLYKLWGQLCSEAQKRLNAQSEQGNRITLVEPGTEKGKHPKARYDIHTLRVSGITDLLDRGVPLNIVSEYVAGHATYIMTLWYDKPSPGAIRNYLIKARDLAGDKAGPLPRFSQDELDELRPHLLSHPDYQDMYTGFDALDDNKGLVLIRQAGICPGGRCDEGGLDSSKRAAPVPHGDRGPSCPQCRFWLTGPAFLLGQVIEGNQLILKVRNKVQSLAALREHIMDAEDAGRVHQADLLRGQADIEERHLNDMLTEWWHRMQFYEGSVRKLDAYKAAQREQMGQVEGDSSQPLTLMSKATETDIRYSFMNASELHLKHFLATCAEILPEFSAGDTGAKQDIELAVGRFLAINHESELTSLFFTLTEEQRLTAANLIVELLMNATSSAETQALLSGDVALNRIPGLQTDITRMLQHSQSKAFPLFNTTPLDASHE